MKTNALSLAAVAFSALLNQGMGKQGEIGQRSPWYFLSMTKKLVIQVGNGVGNSDRRKLKGLRLSRNPLFYMAGTTGLEPAMPGFISQPPQGLPKLTEFVFF